MSEAAERLVALIGKHGSAALVSNLSTHAIAVSVAGNTLPASLNTGEQPTCYINCPSRALLDYGAEELDRFTAHPVGRWAGRGLLRGAGPLVRATGLDRQVQLNNWLVATNILPPASPAQWLDAFEAVGTEYPGFIPVLRSVNRAAHEDVLTGLAAAGLTLLPIRKVFTRDYSTDTAWTTDEAKDARLLAQDDLERRGGESFTPADFDRAAVLYGQLYLDKYSTLNPHYTSLFLMAAQRELGLNLEGLFAPEGTMVGVIGRYEQHGTLTGPIVGYDTTLPQSMGLYRRLRAINHAQARTGKQLYNMSAGAETFKQLRGGVPTLEYIVADVRRAQPAQQRATKMLAALMQRAASALMR